MNKVLVLGGTGMLGSMVVDVLSRDPSLQVRATARDLRMASRFSDAVPGVDWTLYDAAIDGESRLEHAVDGAGWIVNCIGLTKPYAHDGNAEETRQAIRVNCAMPFELAGVAARRGARVLQIATDCVYSGQRGAYAESDPHDAVDVYGKTKSLGEVPAGHVHHLRVSIIGPEPKAYVFLLEWFRRQAANASVKGFVHHLWNGVTTLHFARLCLGAIREQVRLGPMQHVLPSAPLAKLELLQSFRSAYRRSDVAIEPVGTGPAVDRTLSTNDPARNHALWSAAGYAEPPSVPQMVEELARFDYRYAGL